MEPTALIPILPEVACWSIWNEPRRLWFNGHLVRVGAVVVAIDPVATTTAVADAIDRWGRPSLIVVTNHDHERATAEARRHWDAQVLAPRRDTFGFRPDILLDDGDAIAGSMRAVAVAGAKTAGELAVHWPARRLLIVGDAVVGRPAGALSLLPDDKYADVAAARAGVARLADLDIDVVLVGDGDDVMMDGAAKLRAVGAGPARAPSSSTC